MYRRWELGLCRRCFCRRTNVWLKAPRERSGWRPPTIHGCDLYQHKHGESRAACRYARVGHRGGVLLFWDTNYQANYRASGGGQVSDIQTNGLVAACRSLSQLVAVCRCSIGSVLILCVVFWGHFKKNDGTILHISPGIHPGVYCTFFGFDSCETNNIPAGNSRRGRSLLCM